MRTTIAAAGLVALLGAGCANAKHDVSKTGELIELTKPLDCAKVRDIRCEGTDGGFYYQLYCEDINGKMALYTRYRTSDQWTKITVTGQDHIQAYQLEAPLQQ
ncbi:hypothetical protein JW711_06525 [Candidatus Woesearchaeota archaeon]|nr:hypothetical protein [Candidatus Woesearchaeota archaeon]